MKQLKNFLSPTIFGKRSKLVMFLMGAGIFGLLSFTFANFIDSVPEISNTTTKVKAQEMSESENLAEYKYYLEHASDSEIEENEVAEQCPAGVRTTADPGPTLFLPKHKNSSISVQRFAGFCDPLNLPCRFFGEITFMTQPNQTMNYRIQSNLGTTNYNNVTGMESFVFGVAGNPLTVGCTSFKNIILQGQQANGTWRTIRVFRFICVGCPDGPIIIEN